MVSWCEGRFMAFARVLGVMQRTIAQWAFGLSICEAPRDACLSSVQANPTGNGSASFCRNLCSNTLATVAGS